MSSFTLSPPGSLNRNRYWVARGRNDAGRWVEKSTGCQNKAQAKKWLEANLAELRAPRQAPLPQPVPTPEPAAMTYGDAVDAYCTFKGIELGWAPNGDARHNMRRFVRLKDRLGDRPLTGFGGADLVQLARSLKSNDGRALQSATLNREVLVPGRAVYRYAVQQGWCRPLEIKLFATPEPGLRYVNAGIKSRLLAATEGKQHLLLAWLFGTGMRIGDTLERVIWPDPSQPGDTVGIELAKSTVTARIGKTQKVRTFELPDGLVELLEQIPEDERIPGKRLFSWGSQPNVADWLNPLCAKLGIRFTPHMARHTVGHELADAGAGLAVIMSALGHATVSSSMRYQSVSRETLRTAVNRLLPKTEGLSNASQNSLAS